MANKSLFDALDAEQAEQIASGIAYACTNSIDVKVVEAIGVILRECDMSSVKPMATVLNTDNANLYGIYQDGSVDLYLGMVRELDQALVARAEAEEPDLVIIAEIANMAAVFVKKCANSIGTDAECLTDLRTTALALQEKFDGQDEVTVAIGALIDVLPEPEEEAEVDGDAEAETEAEAEAAEVATEGESTE